MLNDLAIFNFYFLSSIKDNWQKVKLYIFTLILGKTNKGKEK
jgi:hypothetical protein